MIYLDNITKNSLSELFIKIDLKLSNYNIINHAFLR